MCDEYQCPGCGHIPEQVEGEGDNLDGFDSLGADVGCVICPKCSLEFKAEKGLMMAKTKTAKKRTTTPRKGVKKRAKRAVDRLDRTPRLSTSEGPISLNETEIPDLDLAAAGLFAAKDKRAKDKKNNDEAVQTATDVMRATVKKHEKKIKTGYIVEHKSKRKRILATHTDDFSIETIPDEPPLDGQA